MHRIDGPGATVDKKFTDGDPIGAVPATVVTDDWLNDVQENICKVIEDASITLVKGSATQLKAAIAAMITASLAPDASETAKGILKLATQALTDARADDLTAVTPKKLGNGFVVSMAANGYIKFPSWLGGWLIQWGTAASVSTSGTAVTFPIAFPTACLHVYGNCADSGGSATIFNAYGKTTTGFTADGSAVNTYDWLAIGH